MKTNVHAALAKTVKRNLPSIFRTSFLYPLITNCCSEIFYLTKFQLLTFKSKKYLFISVNEKFINTKE